MVCQRALSFDEVTTSDVEAWDKDGRLVNIRNIEQWRQIMLSHEPYPEEGFVWVLRVGQ